MRKNIFSLLFGLSCIAAMPAYANWEYSGTYLGDGWYSDNGSRFVMSVRGGAALGFASIKNDVGALTTEYYYNPGNDMVISAAYYDACVAGGGCDGFIYAGIGETSDLPATKDFQEYSFAAGASLGWTIPNYPQWRVEVGWDHIAEAEYNASPLYEGDLTLTGGDVDGIVIRVQSGSVTSKVSTDIISAMAYYDFFDGIQKPLQKMIPYVGFGIGYANTKTTLNLSDPYGDLSTSVDLQNFGELDDYGVLNFYKSEHDSSNIAGVLAGGVSYGITQTMFLDFGARVAYIPKIKWTLKNADGSRTRDWISAENMIYANIMLGLRFEF
ncbi:hypothetical protein HDR61_05160 [bacterium]|nr:hypothetical protein [bacterium]